MSNLKITYAIPVCNEFVEIQRLINFLLSKKQQNDDIVVLYDEKNGSTEVFSFLQTLSNVDIKVYKTPFNGSFSCLKNNLKIRCTGDYIFFVDADELLDVWLIDNIKNILASNPQIDLYTVPRVNIIKNYTQADVQRYNWRVDSNGWFDFPDYQMRIIKNNKNIFWKNDIHEVLVGFKNPAALPAEEKFSIHHVKDIKRQRKQNSFYDSLASTNKTAEENLNIIYRVCDSVSVTSTYKQERDFGTKKEVIHKCFDSLVQTIDNYKKPVNLYVVGDNLSNDVKEYILKSKYVTEFFETKKRGNGNSFAECLDVALTCSGMIFFLEDDYFLDESCLKEMVFFRHKLLSKPKFKHKHICLYPLDEDWYDVKPESATILTGMNKHWKTITHTCCTFLIDDFILRDQFNHLLNYQHYGKPGINEDTSINIMYKTFPCFSPMPSLADHLQFTNCLPPFSKFK
jgi:hypothetical protein